MPLIKMHGFIIKMNNFFKKKKDSILFSSRLVLGSDLFLVKVIRIIKMIPLRLKIIKGVCQLEELTKKLAPT